MSLAAWNFVQPKDESQTSSNLSASVPNNPNPLWFGELPKVHARIEKDRDSFTAAEIEAHDKRRINARFVVANLIAKIDVHIARGDFTHSRRRAELLEFMEQTADHLKLNKFISGLDKEWQRLLHSPPTHPDATHEHAAMIAACSRAMRETMLLKHAAYASIDTEIQKIKDSMLAYATQLATEKEIESAGVEKLSRLRAHANLLADRQRKEELERAEQETRQRESAIERKKDEKKRTRQDNAAVASGLKPASPDSKSPPPRRHF